MSKKSIKKTKSSPKTVEKIAQSTSATATTSVKTQAKVPFRLLLKKSDAIKISATIAVILIAIPVLDMLIQFAIFGRYAAFVGQTQVLRSDYQKELERRYGQTIIQDLIVEKIIDNEMTAQKITITDNTIKTELDLVKAQFSSEDEFNSALKSQDLTLDELKRRIRLKAGLDAIVKSTVAAVNDEEVKKYFDDNPSLFTGKKFDDVKESIKDSLEASNLNNAGDTWINAKLNAYKTQNNLTLQKNNQYKLFGSVSLVSKLFGRN